MLSCKSASEGAVLTLILLMWRIRWAPNNASRWQMGFNSAFKESKLHWCRTASYTWKYRVNPPASEGFSVRLSISTHSRTILYLFQCGSSGLSLILIMYFLMTICKIVDDKVSTAGVCHHGLQLHKGMPSCLVSTLQIQIIISNIMAKPTRRVISLHFLKFLSLYKHIYVSSMRLPVVQTVFRSNSSMTPAGNDIGEYYQML
jgi:hypothetical protein